MYFNKISICCSQVFFCFLFFFIFCFCLPVVAQKFDAEGHFVPATGNTSLYDPKLTIPFSTGSLDEAGYKAIKKQLLNRIEATLAYMDYAPAAVTKIYTQLFGAAFAGRFHQELLQMRAFLKDGTKTPSSFPDLFTYDELESLKSKPLFEKPVPGPGSFEQITFNLPKNDLLANFMLQRYRSTLSDPVATRKMDAGYVDDWKKMEKMFNDLKSIETNIKKLNENIYFLTAGDVAQIKASNDAVDLNSNPLVDQIRHSVFLQKWLWYSGGIPTMNPLGTTPADRRYPATEINTFYTADLQKKQDDLNNSNVLDAFATTKNYYNNLALQIPKNKDDHKYVLAEYDASQQEPGNENYYKTLSGPPNQLKNKLGLKLAIYNVPADQTITPVPAQADLAYQSKGSAVLGDIFNQYLIFQTLLATNLTTFGAAQVLLNSPPAAPRQLRFPGYGESPVRADDKGVNAQGPPPGEMIKGIQIGNQFIPLTGKDLNEDKRRIIVAWYVKEGRDPHEREFRAQLEGFVSWDQNRFLLYDDDKRGFEQQVIKMTGRFITFIADVQKLVDLLKAQLDEVQKKMEETEAYIRITNRSLPPEKFDEKTGKNPMLKTFVYTFKMPAAPVTLTYTITATGPEKDAKAKEVASGSSDVIETQRFDFSVGLSYTFPTYYVTKDATPPSTDIGDHFQFTGGANIYPFGELNKLGRGIGPFYERFSTFLGLSLSQPLNNYFLGLSYDFIPGIRPTVGVHWYKNFRYEVLNGTVIDKASGINTAGMFFSINLEPAILIKKAISK